MPEIILNTSGETRTTGTANPTITGDTGKSGSFADIADGTEIAYYRRYASNKPGFENGIGIWRAVSAAGSIGYIERTSVALSSNGNGPVVWGVGLQTIDATVTPGMIVADDDPRLETVDADDLDPALSLDGTELIAALKDGNGVSLTAQQLLSDPIRQQKSFNLNRSRGYTQFERLPVEISTTVSMDSIGQEPFTLFKSAGGAQVINKAPAAFIPCIAADVTNAGEYCGIRHVNSPWIFVAGVSDLDQRWHINIPTLTTDSHEFIVEIGFTTGNMFAEKGIYLTTSDSSPNWFASVRNAASALLVDTGIAVTTLRNTFRVKYDPVMQASRFWIGGVELPPILDATKVVDPFTPLSMTASVRKINGTGIPRGFIAYAHSYDNQKAAPEHF